jgi:hypothetical protein
MNMKKSRRRMVSDSVKVVAVEDPSPRCSSYSSRHISNAIIACLNTLVEFSCKWVAQSLFGMYLIFLRSTVTPIAARPSQADEWGFSASEPLVLEDFLSSLRELRVHRRPLTLIEDVARNRRSINIVISSAEAERLQNSQ